MIFRTMSLFFSELDFDVFTVVFIIALLSGFVNRWEGKRCVGGEKVRLGTAWGVFDKLQFSGVLFTNFSCHQRQ